eukprot:4520579-Pleurochrysis_carterae.AAC.1
MVAVPLEEASLLQLKKGATPPTCKHISKGTQRGRESIIQARGCHPMRDTRSAVLVAHRLVSEVISEICGGIVPEMSFSD